MDLNATKGSINKNLDGLISPRVGGKRQSIIYEQHDEGKSSQSSDSEFEASEGDVSSDGGEYTDLPILVDQGHQITQEDSKLDISSYQERQIMISEQSTKTKSKIIFKKSFERESSKA